MRRISAFLFLIGVVSACGSEPQKAEPSAEFVGSWKLLKWTAELADGTVVTPYGEKPFGKLVYENNGEMIGIFMASDRVKMSSADVRDRIPEEALDAFNSFFAYSGPFEVVPDSGFVKHYVELCINPNWVGNVQKRLYEFKNDHLILSTPPIAVEGTNSESVEQKLIWERVE